MRANVSTYLIAATLLVTTLASAQVVYTDLTVAIAGNQYLRLDLYLPQPTTTPRPCIIWIHGGSWKWGGKADAACDVPALNALGFAVASIEYRFSSVYTWPAQIHDCKASVRWLRANAATYGLDPDRFFAFGPSAGGHLAAVLGTTGDDPSMEGTIGNHLGTSSAVQGVISFGSPSDLLALPPGTPIELSASQLIGMPVSVLAAGGGDSQLQPWIQLAHSANPGTFASPADPPFYIVHNISDWMVPSQQSELLAAALWGAGVLAELRLVPSTAHSMSLGELARREPILRRFLTMTGGAANDSATLVAPSTQSLGGTMNVALAGGDPGVRYVIGVAPDPGHQVCGRWGHVLLDPNAIQILDVGSLDASGTVTFPVAVPALPALMAGNCYLQALVLNDPLVGNPGLTNLQITHFVP